MEHLAGDRGRAGSLKVTTPPAAEPVLLAEGKDHMRVDITDDDARITGFLLAAREKVEELTGRALISQTLKWVIDAFPAVDDFLRLPLAPVTGVTSVTTIDRTGAAVVFAASNYVVDSAGEPARIVLKDGAIWPDPAEQLQEANGVEIVFTAGFGADGSAVPEQVKLAIKMLAAHWYENRESTIGASLREVPEGVRSLLVKWRAWNRYASVEIQRPRHGGRLD